MKIANSFSAVATCLAAFLLAGCVTDKEAPYIEKPPEQLYNDATAALDKHEYKEAARLFEEVERQHPYSQWATRAQLMAAFVLYQSMQYDESIAALDQFIQVHPGHPQVSYAFYLRSLCYYERIADVRRDQKLTEQALDALHEVVKRFPDSIYARDARLKIELTRDHLAGKEMEVGRYYQQQHICTAAIGRFRTVVEKYQTTSHVPEALHRLVECYMTMGITGEARTTAAVLGYNFPNSTWYAESYRLLTKAKLAPTVTKDSWIESVWKSVKDEF